MQYPILKPVVMYDSLQIQSYCAGPPRHSTPNDPIERTSIPYGQVEIT